MPSRLLTWPGVPISPGRALPGGYLERPLGGVLSTPYMRISEKFVLTNFAFWDFCEVELRLYGVLGSWSGWSCNCFNFLASNSLACASVESNQAARPPL